MHRIALATVFVCLAAAAPVLADPGDQLWSFFGIEDIQTMAHLPADANGDGTHDILIETYDAGATGDHLYLLSGGDSGTPAVIWSARPESGVSNGGGWGDNCLSAIGDLNGDAFPDVVLGTAWGNRSVHALDGLTGAVIWTFDTYDEPASGWVYSVAPHPDRTGDGVPELAFGAGSDNDRGYLLDGADGSVIWRFLGSSDAIGLVRSLPDMNGDGTADVLFGGWDNEHRVFCVSGAGGPVATQIWATDTGGSNHGATVIDDVDGDTVPDVVVGGWTTTNQVRCLSGATGAPVWLFDNGTYQSIMRLVTISDVDGDSFRDVAVGSFDNAVRVVSGATGDLVWESYAGTTNGGDFWAVERVDDVTGDGLDEVVGGSFDHKVYLFDGADGDTLWMFNTARRLYTVRGVPDLSGNFSPDVMAGTQYQSGIARAIAIEGGEDLTAAPPVSVWDARAEFPANAPQRVELRWRCGEPLSFHVYRLGGTADRVTERAALARAHERGEIGTREVLDAIRADGGDPEVLVSGGAVETAGADGDAWTYRLSDELPAGVDPAGFRYRLAALAPGGETVLAELVPVPLPAASSLISSAKLFPNPFNPGTKLGFALERSASVSVQVHDARGRRVASLPPATYPAGEHEIAWTAIDPEGRGLPSGVYFVTLLANGERRELRAVLLK